MWANFIDTTLSSCLLLCYYAFLSQCRFSIFPCLCEAFFCCICPSEKKARHLFGALQFQKSSPGCYALQFPCAGGYHFAGVLPTPRCSEGAEPAKTFLFHKLNGKVGVCVCSSSCGCKGKMKSACRRRRGQQVVPSVSTAVYLFLLPP